MPDMKSSPPQMIRKVLPGVLLAASMFAAQAQDTVVNTSGQRDTGQILEVVNGAIRIQAGPLQKTVPLNQVQSVTMAPPKEFADASAAWQSGDAQKTLQILEPLVKKFQGLPTPWAEQASARLGEALLALNQIDKAQEAFDAFQKAYPQSSGMADIGLARLAIARGDFNTAKEKLTPILEKASQTKYAGDSEGMAYGQAYFLMGQVLENEGDFPQALESYLTTVTVFYQDPGAVKLASEKADALRQKHAVMVP